MVITNIKTFYKEHKYLFVLLVCTQIICTMMILFAYGAFKNSQYKGYEFADTEKITVIFFTDIEDVITGSATSVIKLDIARKIINDITKSSLANDIDGFSVYSIGFMDEQAIESAAYFDGVYSRYCYITSSFSVGFGGKHKNLKRTEIQELSSFDDFSEEQLNKGEAVCFAHAGLMLNQDSFTINGKKYKSLGTTADGNDFNIPLKSLPDDVILSSIYVRFNNPCTKMQYEKLKKIVGKYCSGSDTSFLDLEFRIEVNTSKIDESMKIIAIVSSLFAAFSIGLIFTYIIISREKMTAIYRICGCSRIKSIEIYISEIVILIVLSGTIGSVLFELLFKRWMSHYFQWFPLIYENKIYYLVLLAYIVMVCIFVAPIVVINMLKTPRKILTEL